MAASDYSLKFSGALCPQGTLAGAVGYSATTILLKTLVNVTAGDVVGGMVAMIDDEIIRVDEVNLSNITVTRGCADTVPAVHQAGSVIWFFDSALASDLRPYTSGDIIGVKVLPYSTSGSAIPTGASPPHEVVFNWRHFRPYPPGNVKCGGTAWYNGVKEMPLGVDTLTWTWAHRDRILQADQLVGHLETDIGPEPGTTYEIEVRDHEGNLLRSVTGITTNGWVYTRSLAESDSYATPEAFVDLWSMRDGLRSLQKYRTAIRVLGIDSAIFDFATLGWPGVKTNCGTAGGALHNWGTVSWNDVDVSWSATDTTWANTPVSPISYEHPEVDLGELADYRLSLPHIAFGTAVGEISTSADGITYTSWAPPSASDVNTRYVKARFTVSGTSPALFSAKLSYFRRT